jgi:mono/diheme cytochrome c family protein
MVVLALAVASAGCGSGHGALPGAGGVLFDQSCSECHSLSGVDDRWHQGGDLLHFRSSRAQLLTFTREMPVPQPLNAAQLSDIVDYVRSVQRHPAG